MGRTLHNISIKDIQHQSVTIRISSDRNYRVDATKNIALQVILEAYAKLRDLQASKTSYSLYGIDWAATDRLLQNARYHQDKTFQTWLDLQDKDKNQFVALAENLIANIKVIDREDSWAMIKFEAHVANPDILAALAKDIWWESAMYDYID